MDRKLSARFIACSVTLVFYKRSTQFLCQVPDTLQSRWRKYYPILRDLDHTGKLRYFNIICKWKQTNDPSLFPTKFLKMFMVGIGDSSQYSILSTPPTEFECKLLRIQYFLLFSGLLITRPNWRCRGNIKSESLLSDWFQGIIIPSFDRGIY